mmetsp:Transcript_93798/g.265601  ORF Transcript_93798/g.265601 Transcript_93798/m.265601 type:complete len:279 (+) Transcript_93798:325-1161(+)
MVAPPGATSCEMERLLLRSQLRAVTTLVLPAALAACSLAVPATVWGARDGRFLRTPSWLVGAPARGPDVLVRVAGLTLREERRVGTRFAGVSGLLCGSVVGRAAAVVVLTPGPRVFQGRLRPRPLPPRGGGPRHALVRRPREDGDAHLPQPARGVEGVHPLLGVRVAHGVHLVGPPLRANAETGVSREPLGVQDVLEGRQVRHVAGGGRVRVVEHLLVEVDREVAGSRLHEPPQHCPVALDLPQPRAVPAGAGAASIAAGPLLRGGDHAGSAAPPGTA